MSFGKMNTFIQVIERDNIKDSEGFSTKYDKPLASVRAYREGRHGNEKWANRATFSEATDLFRFRYIREFKVTTSMVIVYDNRYFEITSVEDVKGRKMYTEVLAKEVIASG